MKANLVIAGCAAIAAFFVTTLAGATPEQSRIAAGIAGVLVFISVTLGRQEDR